MGGAEDFGRHMAGCEMCVSLRATAPMPQPPKKHAPAGPTLAIMTVLELPPRLSCRQARESILLGSVACQHLLLCSRSLC